MSTNLEAIRSSKHITAISVVALVGTISLGLWTIVNFICGNMLMGLQNLGVTLGYCTVYFLNRSGRHTLAAVLATLIFLAHMAFVIFLFGHASGAHLFFLVGAVVPYLIYSRTEFVYACASSAISAMAFMACVVWWDALPARVVIVSAPFMETLNSLLVLGILLSVALAFVTTVFQAEDALQAAHRQVNEILLNVLPEAIVERIKNAPEEMIADKYASVSVMFVDVAGFTERANLQRPNETVAMLNKLFSAFDETCRRYGVEKIRTIGDGYMVAAGAPRQIPKHQIAIIDAGLALIDEAAKQKMDIRIGAHCGELAAGVIGMTRYQYDIWGDTVNVAARLEAAGEIGKIHVSEAITSNLDGRYRCVSRGIRQIKGKDAMETWFVEGRDG